MMNSAQNRRFGEIVLGLLLLLIGLNGDGAFSVVLALTGGYLLVRQLAFTAVNGDGRQRHRGAMERMPRHGRAGAGRRIVRLVGALIGQMRAAARERHEAAAVMPPMREMPRREHVTSRSSSTDIERVFPHALEAALSAGLDPSVTSVLPVDIGLMAFRGANDPVIHRTKPILDDVDYIQPFVQIHLSTRAEGRLRFEIIDCDGQALFIHEEIHVFQRGLNLITPAARLPIHDAQNMRSGWELRVSADGVPLAVHRFAWEKSAHAALRRSVRQNVGEDGELSTEVRVMLAENRLQRMTLDDLLGSSGVPADISTPEDERRAASQR